MRLAVLLFCCALTFGQNISSSPEIQSQAPASSPDQKSQKQDYGLGGLDILSDTQGVDFGPYLQRLLHDVKENWYHLIPASASMRRGKLAIEFAITKDGKVADMRLVASSGDVALDRPAWGSITASNPFPPLPSEFTGPYLALRFRFYYNPDKSDLQDTAPAAAAPSGTDHRVWIVKIPNFASCPLTDLQQTVRELASLKPSIDQTGLPTLLDHVGTKILEIVRGTPNLISHETVASKYGATRTRQHFSYLVLPHVHSGERMAFDEFRVNLASGKKFQMEDIERAVVSRPPAGDTSFVPRLLPAPGGPPLAQGFANMWIYFEPLNQLESSFRYLGKQKMNGRDTLVLAFSQKPESVRSPVMFHFEDKILPIFMQGVAWVDASNFKIVRLRTDLLLPIECSMYAS
jgi:TonB family protein